MTLSDYLKTLRQYWLFILLVAVGCAGAAFAYSKLQTPEYVATAAVAVHDSSQDLNLVGSSGTTLELPLQVSSAHVPQVTRVPILAEAQRQVKHELHRFLPLGDIRSMLEVTVDPNSYLVEIAATSSDPREAALVANTVARTDASVSTEQARRGYAAQAERLRQRINSLGAGEKGINQAFYVQRLSSLESLSTVAEPVALHEEARIPTSPATPKTLRNTLAAGIFGLLFGIGLALVRQLLDRKLREPSDVEELFERPLVAKLRAEALGHTGSSRDAEFKKLGPLDAIESEAFRMLRENVRYLAVDEDLRSFAITSAIPEEGKSTVAACLAMASAAAGTRTLLLECDLRRRILADRLGIPEAPGLSDYLVGQAEPQEVLQQVPMSVGPETNGSTPHSLVVITAGSAPPHPADLLRSKRFEKFLAQIRVAYELVVVDCPPLLPVVDAREIVPHVDAVLNCVRLGWTTREQAQAASDALEQLPDRPTGIVITAFKQRDRDYYTSYYRYRAEDEPIKKRRTLRRAHRADKAEHVAAAGADAVGAGAHDGSR